MGVNRTAQRNMDEDEKENKELYDALADDSDEE